MLGFYSLFKCFIPVAAARHANEIQKRKVVGCKTQHNELKDAKTPWSAKWNYRIWG